MFRTNIYFLIYSLFRLLISVHPPKNFSITPEKRAQHTQIYLHSKTTFHIIITGYQKKKKKLLRKTKIIFQLFVFILFVQINSPVFVIYFYLT